MLRVTDAWKAAYPGAVAGELVVRGAGEATGQAPLDARKEEVERELRARFTDRKAAASHPIIQAYEGYYKRFKKTYHVQLQVESVAFKGKPIPRVLPIVEAMFVAELKDMLLTAVHDLDKVVGPVTVDVAKGGERYATLGDREEELKPGDMFMADAKGIISSILYGPDKRTAVTAATRDALFAVYAPPGIGEEAVRAHLLETQACLLLASPSAHTEALETHVAP